MPKKNKQIESDDEIDDEPQLAIREFCCLFESAKFES
jgi:hypothetical protein